MELPTRPGDSRFFDALRLLGKSLLVGLGHRFDLFSLELEEEKQRIFAAVFLALVAAFAIFMAFLFLNLVVLLLNWDGNRLLVAILMGVFYLVVAGGAALWLRHRIRTSPQPFAASLEEFRKDCASISSEDA